MYSTEPGLVLGFHGCDRGVAERVIAGKGTLEPSKNNYDWLGHGIYFWESNPQRALEYAEFIQANPDRANQSITRPAVIGAVIDLGFCLNLLESRCLREIQESYHLLVDIHQKSGEPIPMNIPVGGAKDQLPRKLDCAVVELAHAVRKTMAADKKDKPKREYDSVRGVFVEGKELYENSGFNDTPS